MFIPQFARITYRLTCSLLKDALSSLYALSLLHNLTSGSKLREEQGQKTTQGYSHSARPHYDATSSYAINTKGGISRPGNNQSQNVGTVTQLDITFELEEHVVMEDQKGVIRFEDVEFVTSHH